MRSSSRNEDSCNAATVGFSAALTASLAAFPLFLAASMVGIVAAMEPQTESKRLRRSKAPPTDPTKEEKQPPLA